MSHKKGIYEKYVKRPQDFICALLASVVLSPILLLIAVLVRIKLGSPILFAQERPGLDGKVFKMYKFRTMTNEVDEQGNPLPDEVRLTSFGKKLRSLSLDGNVIIGTTTETIENTGFREVSPIHFFRGRDLISYNDLILNNHGGVRLLA